VSYRVRKGDTFLGIADRFSVDADDLKKWNRLKANKVSRGMVLRIYTQGGAPEAVPARSRSVVKKKSHRTGTAAAQAGTPAGNHRTLGLRCGVAAPEHGSAGRGAGGIFAWRGAECLTNAAGVR
jgi:LysM domain